MCRCKPQHPRYGLRLTTRNRRICWPFGAEQPLNAAHLTTNLDVAYELLEVRTGEHGLKPIYRTGKAPSGSTEAVRVEADQVLRSAFGDEGKRKRDNVEKLQRELSDAWAEQGSSRLALTRFLSSF